MILWAAVLAQRASFSWPEALSLGSAVAAMIAKAKVSHEPSSCHSFLTTLSAASHLAVSVNVIPGHLAGSQHAWVTSCLLSTVGHMLPPSAPRLCLLLPEFSNAAQGESIGIYNKEQGGGSTAAGEEKETVEILGHRIFTTRTGNGHVVGLSPQVQDTPTSSARIASLTVPFVSSAHPA